MAGLHAVYYRAPDGTEPVRDFLDVLEVEVAATLALQIDRLNLLSDEVPHLPFPHSSQVDGSFGSFAATTAGSCSESSTAVPIDC